MSKTYQRIVLASRPQGAVTPENFRLETVDLPELQDGQVLVRNHFLSLDPYMRGRMNDSKSYAQPQPLDEVMIGGTVGVVEASRNPSFAVGDSVVGMFGWQEVGISDGRGIQKVDTRHIPLSAYLGAVGMPGVTAWYGLNKIMHPKPGQTVAVSAASGAVGSVVGQLAKLKGCRAVGFAGGKDKCDYVVNELGFDACIDYKAAKDPKELYKMLKEATPDGIDSYFENVGGTILDAVLSRMNPFGRIAMCGMIAGYDGQPLPMQNPQLILVSRLTIEGFIVSEHMDVWPEALRELGGYVAQGKLKFRESVAQGLASAPEAFMGLLKGKNFGKQLVKLV
ncbi:NADP-dependent oxidoreductase [Ralstonia mannitolilytica]|jgi:NADPH-dependent curcumin reductase CurA|uniref:NADP-dependent oxidoreductase YfmJ n=1 Tax=Ralstonia mannitolilytica TaxID=105219 RepID=A0AAD2AMC0_9RALS|nr:NADP-dependent oxidoreductase [Ralstonia mannitolilytica]ATG19934.1 NADP-dependent oxidoreductase [Ralstonia pickettii]ANA31972.1 2-alkenal reductase [Ralstonia mannitolilytica]MBY4719568.1 NADP-dependent oxidoreductase [Ralstonia mannitolilytica]CAJ0679558.1 Putative NADP-dependent oxidoreductase YfmJ [Ralstonia mannitolilytica]CAJ0694930.1 Putative NADP-dependent oxidoreductase YfmJ [Ralstonia mannitolilytica]